VSASVSASASNQDYEFVSSEAREQFEQLMAELERDVLNTYFEKSKEMMADPTRKSWRACAT